MRTNSTYQLRVNFMCVEFSGSHGGEYEYCCLLGSSPYSLVKFIDVSEVLTTASIIRAVSNIPKESFLCVLCANNS
jgi:hypothetical protein